MIDPDFRGLYMEKESHPGGYYLRYSTHFGVVVGRCFLIGYLSDVFDIEPLRDYFEWAPNPEGI